MKARYRSTGTECFAIRFNVHALAEIITEDDSVYISDLDVQLSDGTWKPMADAFRDKDIIPDNYHTDFREPLNEEERQRGYYD